MIKETMTKEQRVLAAINLEPYDRVPVAPHINLEYAFRFKGRPAADAYNLAVAGEGIQAMFDLYDSVGGWDACTLPTGSLPVTPHYILLLAIIYGNTMKYPGQDSRLDVNTSPQYAEREVMTVKDYDEIIEKGWHRFLEDNRERICGTFMGIPTTLSELPGYSQLLTGGYAANVVEWAKRGVPVMAGALLSDPEMILSLMRTAKEFTLDLYRRPDKVKKALDVMSKDITQGAIDSMLLAGPPPKRGIPGIMVSCERGGGTYYNLKTFEYFVWPYIKEEVEAWWKAGFVTTLHFDTDWIKNMPYLRELPRKSCIVELDSKTDMFKTKDILGDHLCLMGDVPASISAKGSVDDMEQYCAKLIEYVGKDTGLILSNGCAVPPDTKYENFKAMINSVKKYAPGRTKK